MVPVNGKAYFDALCFIEQCLPTREIRLRHLAVACDINTKDGLRLMLDDLKEQKIIAKYDSYDTWSRNDSYDCSEIVGYLYVAKPVTKARIREKSEELLPRIQINDPWPNDVIARSKNGSEENTNSGIKSTLPRKYQVKVLLNDVELRYLETLIGEIGDDKASVFRNLLHASFVHSVTNECETQRAERLVNAEGAFAGVGGEKLDLDSLRGLLNDLKNLVGESDDEWLGIECLLQYPRILGKYQKRGVASENFNFFLGDEEPEALKLEIKNAVMADGNWCIAIREGEGSAGLIEAMEDYLKGVRLVYDGTVDSVNDTISSSFRVYEFRRGD